MAHYLIVDDNRALAENLAEILRDAGHDVLTASDGDQALALVKQTRFDAVLTDMRMPGMGGAQLVAEMRQLDPGLPALVITAYSGESDLLDVTQQGLLAVLPKPVPIAHLMELLATVRRDALVMVVEDDVHLSDNLRETLQQHGFSSVSIRSAQELTALAKIKPFAALVDLRIPGSPSGEVLRQVADRFHGVALLVMTGFPQQVPAVHHEALFAKPFDTATLVATLERLHRNGVAP